MPMQCISLGSFCTWHLLIERQGSPTNIRITTRAAGWDPFPMPFSLQSYMPVSIMHFDCEDMTTLFLSNQLQHAAGAWSGSSWSFSTFFLFAESTKLPEMFIYGESQKMWVRVCWCHSAIRALSIKPKTHSCRGTKTQWQGQAMLQKKKMACKKSSKIRKYVLLCENLHNTALESLRACVKNW